MRGWYRESDLPPGRAETVIGPDSSLPQSIDRILLDSGPADSAARDR